MTETDTSRVERPCPNCGVTLNGWSGLRHCGHYTTHAHADCIKNLRRRAEKAEAERDEARRRRDEWRKKAEGYDDVRRALREKVGDPWPPHMSRILWAGIAADEKKRADEAEAERDTAWNDAIEAAAATAKLHNLGRCYEMSQRQINAIMALRKGDPT